MFVLQDIRQRDVVLGYNCSRQLVQYGVKAESTADSLVNLLRLGSPTGGGGFHKRDGNDLIVVTFNDHVDGCSLLVEGESTGIGNGIPRSHPRSLSISLSLPSGLPLPLPRWPEKSVSGISVSSITESDDQTTDWVAGGNLVAPRPADI